MRVVVAIVLTGLVPLASAASETLNCVILPDEQVELGSPVPGVVEHINVRRSQRVKAGQAIARLESSVERATVALAHARASSDTEIELRRVEHGYETQHRNRLHTLQVRQAVSPQSMDDAERAAEAAQLRVRLAQDRRREAVLDQRRADAVLALKTIVSPIDGVVLQLNKRVGEYVESQPIARIARLDPLRVEVIAPLALFGIVREGMQVAVSPETDLGRERIATVSAVDAVADAGSGTFGIQLSLPNPGLELPAGIKCTGRLLALSQVKTHEPTPTESRAVESTVLISGRHGDQAKPRLAEAGDSSAASAAEPAPAPHIRVPGICLAFGPHEFEKQAQDLASAAQRLGARVALAEIDAHRVIGYIVVTKPASQPQLDALAARFHEAGVVDLAIMGRGDYAGRIALGTYNGPRSAERRRSTLAALGFDAEVLPRMRTRSAWRVEVRLPEQTEPDVALAALKREVGTAVTQPDACAALRTAAR